MIVATRNEVTYKKGLNCKLPRSYSCTAYPPNIGYVVRASTRDEHVLQVKGTNDFSFGYADTRLRVDTISSTCSGTCLVLKIPTTMYSASHFHGLEN